MDMRATFHRPASWRTEQVWDLHYIWTQYQFDEDHARFTAKFAAVCSSSQTASQPDDENLLLLEMGSLLHDIGHFINSVDHDKHGYYLLNTNRLIGLAQREQNIVANLVRYHRQNPLNQG